MTMRPPIEHAASYGEVPRAPCPLLVCSLPFQSSVRVPVRNWAMANRQSLCPDLPEVWIHLGAARRAGVMTGVPKESVALSQRGSCLDIAQDLAGKLKALPNGQVEVELRRLLDSRSPSEDWRGSVLSIHVPIATRAAAILGLREPATLVDTIAERYVEWSLAMPHGPGRATMDGFPAGTLRGVVGERLLRRLDAAEDHPTRDKALG